MTRSTDLAAVTAIQAKIKNKAMKRRKNKKRRSIEAVRTPIKASIQPRLKAKNATLAEIIMQAKAAKRAIQVPAKVADTVRARAQRIVKEAQAVDLLIVTAPEVPVKSITKAEARNAIVVQAAATNITITRVAVIILQANTNRAQSLINPQV